MSWATYKPYSLWKSLTFSQFLQEKWDNTHTNSSWLCEWNKWIREQNFCSVAGTISIQHHFLLPHSTSHHFPKEPWCFVLYLQNCKSFLFRMYSFAQQPSTIPRSSLILLTSFQLLQLLQEASAASLASAGRTISPLCSRWLLQTSLSTYAAWGLLLTYSVSSPGTRAPWGQALPFTYLYFQHLTRPPVENTFTLKTQYCL